MKGRVCFQPFKPTDEQNAYIAQQIDHIITQFPEGFITNAKAIHRQACHLFQNLGMLAFNCFMRESLIPQMHCLLMQERNLSLSSLNDLVNLLCHLLNGIWGGKHLLEFEVLKQAHLANLQQLPPENPVHQHCDFESSKKLLGDMKKQLEHYEPEALPVCGLAVFVTLITLSYAHCYFRSLLHFESEVRPDYTCHVPVSLCLWRHLPRFALHIHRVCTISCSGHKCDVP